MNQVRYIVCFYFVPNNFGLGAENDSIYNKIVFYHILSFNGLTCFPTAFNVVLHSKRILLIKFLARFLTRGI